MAHKNFAQGKKHTNPESPTPSWPASWPGALELDKDIALDQAFDYVESVAKKDMNCVVDKVRRDDGVYVVPLGCLKD